MMKYLFNKRILIQFSFSEWFRYWLVACYISTKPVPESMLIFIGNTDGSSTRVLMAQGRPTVVETRGPFLIWINFNLSMDK